MSYKTEASVPPPPGYGGQSAQMYPPVYNAPPYPQAPQYGGPPQPVYLQPPYGQAPPVFIQPPPGPPSGPERWSTGLCGCCDDCFSCCLTCFLPCVAFGQIAQKVDDADHSACFGNGFIYTLLCFMGLPCCYSCLYRGKMRRKYHLPEQPCNDFCTHCCCEWCALCQEYRELQNRGIDPTDSSAPRPMVMMAPAPPAMR